jgi:hypothetical protein
VSTDKSFQNKLELGLHIYIKQKRGQGAVAVAVVIAIGRYRESGEVHQIKVVLSSVGLAGIHGRRRTGRNGTRIQI